MSVDAGHSLGRCKMPDGYKLIQLDSGHFIWRHDASDDESSIHLSKWVVYAAAHKNDRKRNGDPKKPEKMERRRIRSETESRKAMEIESHRQASKRTPDDPISLSEIKQSKFMESKHDQ